MRHGRVYDLLISSAHGRERGRGLEGHHVVPRCMGGSDDPSNIVCLSFKAHYVAHHLLWKMHLGNAKLASAFLLMVGRAAGGQIVHAREYARLKESAIDVSPAVRSERSRRANAILTSAERSERSRRSAASTPPEVRRERARKAGLATAARYSAEEKSQQCIAATPPEIRVERARKAGIAATSVLSFKERSKRSRKAAVTRRLNQGVL